MIALVRAKRESGIPGLGRAVVQPISFAFRQMAFEGSRPGV
jgi:hypothetical protein